VRVMQKGVVAVRDMTAAAQAHAAHVSHTKGALEVVRVSNFSRLSKQLAVLAQAVSEAPQIADAKRAEALQVQEQSLSLAAAGGVRVPSAALLESVQQQGTSTTFITAEVSRMAGELREAREGLAGQTAELQRLCSEVRERFRETSHRFETIGAWREALDDLRSEVHGGAERFARSEAERLQGKQLESHLFLDGRIEELHGICRAQDADNSKGFKAVESQQVRIDERLKELTSSLQQAQNFPAQARDELHTAREALEENIYACRRHVDSQKLSLQEDLRRENQMQASKQSHAAAELHRQIRALEKALREMRAEQEEAHSRLTSHVDSTRAGVEQQLQQRCEGLHNALEAQHKLMTLGQEEVSAAARRYVDEARDATLPKIETAARLAETTAKISAQRLAEDLRAEVAAQVRDLGKQIDAGAKKTKKDIATELEKDAKRTNDRLDFAVGDVLKKMEEQQAELKEEVSSARLEAAQACEGLAARTGSQFDYHNALMTEQAGLLRSDVEKNLSSLHTELAVVREDVRSSLQQEVATIRQLCSAQEAQQASDVESLRETLLVEINAHSRRLTQADERLREQLAQASEDSHRALEAQGRVLQDARASLDSDVRRLLTQAEQSLRSVVASEFNRVEALEGSLTKAGAEGLANQRRAEEAIEAVKASLEQVREESSVAQSQARNAEAAVRQCADSLTQLRDAEMRSQVGSLEELRSAVGSLTTGLMKVAQCCGLIGGLDEGRCEQSGHVTTSPHMPAKRIGIKELLAWEQSGTPLVARIESAWVGRCAGTLLELVQQKADMSALRVVQAAMRELDARSLVNSRSTNYAAMRAWRESSASRESNSGACVRVGEPFVGAYGSHARRSISGAAAAAAAANDSIDTTASRASLVSSHMRSDTMISLNVCASMDQAVNSEHLESTDQAPEPACRPSGPPPVAEGPLQRRAHVRSPAASEVCAPNSDVRTEVAAGSGAS